MSKDLNTLQGWIAVATSGLPPSAAAKLSAEIRDHAEESRRRHIDAGMSEADADRAALADLGDAAQVARTFRDSHFSRVIYKRGWIATLVFLCLSGVSTLFPMIYDTQGWVERFNPPSSGLALMELLGGLGSIVLMGLIARAMLRLLKEQYEIEVPRWGWIVCGVGLLLLIVPALVLGLLVWLQAANPTGSELTITPIGVWIVQTGMALSPIISIVLGGLIAVFCARQLAAHSTRSGLSLVILMGLGMTLGLETALVAVVNLALAGAMGAEMANATTLLSRAISIPATTAQTLISTALALPFLALIACALWLFGRMRHPGAAIAR